MDLSPPPCPVFDLAAFSKCMVEAAIWAARGDPTDMKQRIMLAWEHGHLTADETEDWIVLQGLASA